MDIREYYLTKKEFWFKHLSLLKREGGSFGYDLKVNSDLSSAYSFAVSYDERDQLTNELYQENIREYVLDFKKLIVHEERHFMILFKPPGMLSQLDYTNQPSIIEYGKLYLKLTEKKQGNIFFAPVHRLDRPASGLLIIARTSKAARRFSVQFANGQVKKHYYALVSGHFSQKSGEIIASLKKEKQKTMVRKRTALESEAEKTTNKREGKLYYKEVAKGNNCSLLSVQIDGGFFHQIRSMLAFAGHPIVGDYKYTQKKDTSKKNNSRKGKKQISKMIPLFENEITMNHPITSKTQHFVFEYNEKELFLLWFNIFNN